MASAAVTGSEWCARRRAPDEGGASARAAAVFASRAWGRRKTGVGLAIQISRWRRLGRITGVGLFPHCLVRPMAASPISTSISHSLALQMSRPSQYYPNCNSSNMTSVCPEQTQQGTTRPSFPQAPTLAGDPQPRNTRSTRNPPLFFFFPLPAPTLRRETRQPEPRTTSATRHEIGAMMSS